MLMLLESDEDLLRHYQEGNDRAFETLYKRHRRRLWGLARKLAWDPQQAEDILCEAMAAVAIQARRGSIQGSFVGYALTAVHHRGLHVIERRNERDSRGAVPLTLHLLDRGPSPEEQMQQMDLRAEVALALDELPTEERVAVYLVDGQGLSYRDVAQVLSCSEATVKRRLREARRSLAVRLAHLQGQHGHADRGLELAEGAE
jgi:RNA polymerase sigma-70 factor (ECF subfamily)